MFSKKYLFPVTIFFVLNATSGFGQGVRPTQVKDRSATDLVVTAAADAYVLGTGSILVSKGVLDDLEQTEKLARVARSSRSRIGQRIQAEYLSATQVARTAPSQITRNAAREGATKAMIRLQEFKTSKGAELSRLGHVALTDDLATYHSSLLPRGVAQTLNTTKVLRQAANRLVHRGAILSLVGSVDGVLNLRFNSGIAATVGRAISDRMSSKSAAFPESVEGTPKAALSSSSVLR
jgi:hypothetical protein